MRLLLFFFVVSCCNCCFHLTLGMGSFSSCPSIVKVKNNQNCILNSVSLTHLYKGWVQFGFLPHWIIRLILGWGSVRYICIVLSWNWTCCHPNSSDSCHWSSEPMISWSPVLTCSILKSWRRSQQSRPMSPVFGFNLSWIGMGSATDLLLIEGWWSLGFACGCVWNRD